MTMRRDLIVAGAALPLALFGIAMPPNEYRAWGLDAVDCDGPIAVMLFALPSLAIYGLGTIAYGLPFRRCRRLLFAVPCAILFALLALQVVRALEEQHKNTLAPETCG